MVAALFLAGTAGCFGGGGNVSSPCDGPADDEPAAVVVSSSDPAVPDVIRGCVDSSDDTDIITLNRPGNATGTWTFSVRCQAAAGVADFDTPAVLDPGTRACPAAPRTTPPATRPPAPSP